MAETGSTRCSNCGGFLQSEPIEDLYKMPPELPHHLAVTNEPPSDTEAAKVQEINFAVETHISDVLDESIAALETLIQKLRTRRKHAVEHLRRGRGILSLIRRLPVEILGEIFSFTLPDDRKVAAIHKSPWILGRICSRWRAASISLSSLWTEIPHDLPKPLVIAQLKRSEPRGLAIHLVHSDINAIVPLVAWSCRWETLNLQIGYRMLPFLSDIRGNVPMLRHLKYGDSTGVGCLDAFEVAPRLSSVVLTGKGSLSLPWIQIKRLRQRIPTNLESLQQLGSARNLVKLSLCNYVSLSLMLMETRGLPPSARQEFPSLRVMYLEDGNFLNFLILPALEDIYICKNLGFLIPLITRSSCRLRKFTAEDGCSHEDVVSVMKRSPTLRELRLRTIHSGLRIPTLLTPCIDNGFRPACPNLRVLHLCNMSNLEACSRVFEMMEARQKSTAYPSLSLRIVDFDATALNVSARETLEKLRDILANVKWVPGKLPHGRVVNLGWMVGYP